MYFRALLFAFLVALCGAPPAASQTTPKFPGSAQNDRRTGDAAEDSTQNSPYREMLKTRELKHEEGMYKEHVERAKENAQLALELKEAYAERKILQAQDLKKLNRMEKLSRQIRNNAGGEESKDELKETPQQVGAALGLLADLSAELQKKVESTPRQVVSAAVIKRANEVVELVRHIRTLFR